MKGNSREEDIKILEEKMNKELDFLIENANKTEQLTAISIIAMKEPIILLFLSILSDYKRVLKENEYMHNELNKQQTTINKYAKENEELLEVKVSSSAHNRILELEKENEELKRLHIQDNKHLDFIMEHSIPIQKIKDKIEEYKNMLKTCNKAKDIDRIKAINERILELEELLEGRK